MRIYLPLFIVLLAFVGCSTKELASTASRTPSDPTRFTPQEDLAALTNFHVRHDPRLPTLTLPEKPTPPTFPKKQQLVKSQFETMAQFHKRQHANDQAHADAVRKLKEQHAEAIRAYNAEVKRKTEAHNATLAERLPVIRKEALQNAFGAVYGAPRLTHLRYDAETERFYADLNGTQGGFHEQVVITVPQDVAPTFFAAAATLRPRVHFVQNGDQVMINEIRVPYAGRTYAALLSKERYEPRTLPKSTGGEVRMAEVAPIPVPEVTVEPVNPYTPKLVDNTRKIKEDERRLEAERRKRVEAFLRGKDDLPDLLADLPAVEPRQDAYAIVIGIEDYQRESRVTYSRRSAKMFVHYARKLLGVPTSQIWDLSDPQMTTSGSIKSEWLTFIGHIPAGATVYFYYSGHGAPGSSGMPYLLPRDMNDNAVIGEHRFRLDTLYDDLARTNAARIFAFVDSCFSGKDETGAQILKDTGPLLHYQAPTIDATRMTIFSAGSSSQLSNSYEPRRHRLFSYYLMRGLAEGKTRIRPLHAYVRKSVFDVSRGMGERYYQEPELRGNAEGALR